MKVIDSLIQQDFSKPTPCLKRLNYLSIRLVLFSLFLVNSLFLTGQITTFIDCECDMNPSVTLFENSGILADDGIICAGGMATLTARGGVKYLWSTGETTPAITVTSSGGYGVTISDATNCQAIENILITEHSKPFLVHDDFFCEGSTTTIQVNAKSSNCIWSNGSTGKSLLISEGGTYAVTITDDYGCVHVETATITKNPVPIVDIIVTENSGNVGDLAVCLGAEVTLQATTGYAAYQWTPIDGLANPSSATTTANPTATTTYTIVVTDHNGCTSTEQVTIVVNDLNTTISPNVNICEGDSTLIFASGGTSYSWSPAEGLSNTNIANPAAAPATTTTYTVIISDNNGCVTTREVTVGVFEINTTVGDSLQICLGERTTLSASGGVTYAWSPTTSLDNASLANPIATPATTTTYNVLITDANGCISTYAQTVEVGSATAEIQGITLLCLGDSTALTAVANSNATTANFTYLWNDLAGNSTSNQVIVSPTVSSTYRVTITDENGCTAVDSVLVTVNDYQVEAGNNQLICLGDSTQLIPEVTLNGVVVTDGIVSYTWSPVIRIDSSTSSLPIVFPTTNTVYTVTITDTNGCTAVDSMLVSVNDLQVEAGGNQIICPRDSVQLTSITTLNGDTVSDNSVSYFWSPSSGLDDAIIPTPTASPSTPTTYFLTVTDANGCTAVDSVFVDLHPQTNINLGVVPQSIIYFESASIIYIQNNATPIVDFIWSPTNFLDCPNDTTLNCSQPIFRDELGFDSIYTYELTVVDANGCTDQTTVDINVNINNVAPPIPMAAISGSVYMEDGTLLKDGLIHLEGAEKMPIQTGGTGEYLFEEVPMYENYIVQPEKDTHPLEGVSTADVLAISKHILGIDLLDSPYKIIAADVNRSGTITIFDIVQLRKLILNTIDVFPNNDSWRFIDASYQFKNPSNPLTEDLPENYIINTLFTDMNQLDFIAVKIGDVNSSLAQENLQANARRSSKGVFSFNIQMEEKVDENRVLYHFHPEDFNDIEGYQFTIDFDVDQLEFRQLETSSLVGEENFGWTLVEAGTITTSWYKMNELLLEEGEPLFSLSFDLNKQNQKEVDLSITSSRLQAEAYHKSGEVLEVKWTRADQSSIIPSNDFALFQNQPNPFTRETTIGFNLPDNTNATLRIFNTAGKIIQQFNGPFTPGYNGVIIRNNKVLEHGTLYYQLVTDEQVVSKKMIHIE